ncbi:glutathione S-transferase [Alteromonas stellipolaris]|uniref:glutathione S-transferase family protein n=1 Tax=Alteromonas stellipolaris TaxID=233316 RepID=UPI0030F5718E
MTSLSANALSNTQKNNAIIHYRNPKSGHCHKVELFMSLLGISYHNHNLDMVNGAHKSAEFITKNPFGQVPVIVDGEHTVSDSNAIIVYLADTYGSDYPWMGTTAIEKANVQRWLSVAAGELAKGPAALRLEYVFGANIDVPTALATTETLLHVMEDTLSGPTSRIESSTKAYLATERLTLADIAMYSYIAHAPEGGVSLHPYPAIQSWINRIESLDNFIPMANSATADYRL